MKRKRSSFVTDRFQYGYDRAGNRLYKDNLLSNNFDELYHADGATAGYDLLNRLVEWQRGGNIKNQVRRGHEGFGKVSSLPYSSTSATTPRWHRPPGSRSS